MSLVLKPVALIESIPNTDILVALADHKGFVLSHADAAILLTITDIDTDSDSKDALLAKILNNCTVEATYDLS